MLKPLLFLLLLYCSMPVQAQRTYSHDKLRTHAISLPTPGPEGNRLFHRITVVDKRFDTSKAGFMSDDNRHRLLYMKNGVAAGLQSYLNAGYTQNDPALPQLLFVLRNLWLHDVKAGEIKKGEDGNDKGTISRCVAKIEVYLVKEDTCQALLRIDTTAEELAPLRAAGSRMLAGILEQGMKKMMALDVQAATAKKTKMPLTDLMKLYDKRFEAPRLVADTLQRGIYLSFADFLQKRPKPYDFVLEQDDSGDFLYLNENGKQRLFTEFWGFCDGKSHYIKLGGSFFPLVRDENTYSFYGCLQPVHNAAPRSSNRVARYALFGVFGDVHSNRLVNFLRPMQVDMESGRAH